MLTEPVSQALTAVNPLSRSWLVWTDQQGPTQARRPGKTPFASQLKEPGSADPLEQIFCRKEISYAGLSKQEKHQFIAEYNILATLRHPNIVAYYHREHLKVTQDVHMYMEYCGNGDLGKVIKDLKATGRFADEDFVWSIFAQLVTALYRCHYGVDPPQVGKNVTVTGNNILPGLVSKEVHDVILHRDLKPDNGMSSSRDAFLPRWCPYTEADHQSFWARITPSSWATLACRS